MSTKAKATNRYTGNLYSGDVVIDRVKITASCFPEAREEARRLAEDTKSCGIPITKTGILQEA